MRFKTRLDEDDGFGMICPLRREYTFSRVNPQSRAYAAILGQTVLGPIIEVHIVKIIDSFGIEIAIPSPNDPRRTSCVLICRGRVESVTNCTFPMSNIESPARNYFLNMRTQKKANFACRSQRQAQGNLLRLLLQVILAAGNRCGLSQRFSQPSVFVHKKNRFLRRKGSGELFLPIYSVEDLSQQRYPKWFRDWFVIMIKKNNKLIQQFIGARQGQYW